MVKWMSELSRGVQSQHGLSSLTEAATLDGQPVNNRSLSVLNPVSKPH